MSTAYPHLEGILMRIDRILAARASVDDSYTVDLGQYRLSNWIVVGSYNGTHFKKIQLCQGESRYNLSDDSGFGEWIYFFMLEEFKRDTKESYFITKATMQTKAKTINLILTVNHVVQVPSGLRTQRNVEYTIQFTK
jgi:hypothetical protein